MSNRTITELQSSLEQIQRETAAIASERRQGKIKALSDSIKAGAEALEHSQRSAAFVQFKESEAYILELQEEIAATGIVAIDTAGNSYPLEWLDDSRSKARLFGTLKVGSTVQVNGYVHLVTEFNFSFAGSEVSLQAMSSKMFLDGMPVTPFGGTAVHFHNGTKTLTVAARDRLQAGQAVNIGGVKYLPKSSYLTKGFFRYELEAAE